MLLRYYWDKVSLKMERMMYRILPMGYDPLSDYKIYCIDGEYSDRSLVEIIHDLQSVVENLQERVLKLENENVGLTNELYEIYNTIDSQHQQTTDLSKFSLEK